MPNTYSQRFEAAGLVIARLGRPVSMRAPDGSLREAGDVRRLGLDLDDNPDVREYLNQRRSADLGRIASMRATWFPPEEEAEAAIAVGCKHVSSILSDKKSPVWLEREYILTSNPDNNLIVDLPSGPVHPNERNTGIERLALDTDTAFINSMLIGIAHYYPRA